MPDADPLARRPCTAWQDEDIGHVLIIGDDDNRVRLRAEPTPDGVWWWHMEGFQPVTYDYNDYPTWEAAAIAAEDCVLAKANAIIHAIRGPVGGSA